MLQGNLTLLLLCSPHMSLASFQGLSQDLVGHPTNGNTPSSEATRGTIACFDGCTFVCGGRIQLLGISAHYLQMHTEEREDLNSLLPKSLRRPSFLVKSVCLTHSLSWP